LYTALLVIALVAVLLGILFLYLEMDFYEFKIKGGPPLVMGKQLFEYRNRHLERSEGSGVNLAEILRCAQDDNNPSPLFEHGCSTSKTS
jgi:hypothetical protein